MSTDLSANQRLSDQKQILTRAIATGVRHTPLTVARDACPRDVCPSLTIRSIARTNRSVPEERSQANPRPTAANRLPSARVPRSGTFCETVMALFPCAAQSGRSRQLRVKLVSEFTFTVEADSTCVGACWPAGPGAKTIYRYRPVNRCMKSLPKPGMSRRPGPLNPRDGKRHETHDDHQASYRVPEPRRSHL